jgi:hypothetical protein
MHRSLWKICGYVAAPNLDAWDTTNTNGCSTLHVLSKHSRKQPLPMTERISYVPPSLAISHCPHTILARC